MTQYYKLLTNSPEDRLEAKRYIGKKIVVVIPDCSLAEGELLDVSIHREDAFAIKYSSNVKVILIPIVQKITGDTSDGYHTFNELYEHRHALFCALSQHSKESYKSKFHDDGTMYDGYFVAGISTDKGIIDYHLPIRLWDAFNGKEIDRFFACDGHTADDVISRLAYYEATKERDYYDYISRKQAENKLFGKLCEFSDYGKKWIKGYLAGVRDEETNSPFVRSIDRFEFRASMAFAFVRPIRKETCTLTLDELKAYYAEKEGVDVEVSE
jgi:hypothetical protein